MFKLNKLADYATVLMAYIAAHAGHIFTARDLAEATHITLPTVGKILKIMAKAKLLRSTRGAKGGYELAKPATDISIAAILFAIEDKVAVTDCSHKAGECSLERYCSIRCNWQLISQTILNALESLSLADMAKPMLKKQISASQQIFLDAIRF